MTDFRVRASGLHRVEGSGFKGTAPSRPEPEKLSERVWAFILKP